jgi:hypothetical protein
MVKTPKTTIALLLPVVLLLPTYAIARTEILGIRHCAGHDHTRIVIDTSKEAQYDVEKGEQKISIDLKNTVFPRNIPAEIVLSKPGIDKIILIPLTQRTVRVQLSLAENVKTKVFSLKKFQRKPYRVVVDIEFPETKKKEGEKSDGVGILRKDKATIIEPDHGGEEPGAIEHQEIRKIETKTLRGENVQEKQAPVESGMKRFLHSLDFGGDFTTKVAYDINKDNNVEELFDFRNHVLLKLQSKPNNKVKLFASEQIKYLLFKNTDTDDNLESNFWEGYIDLSFQNCDLRIGKQIVRWGKTDELSPLDIINPQEYEEFVLPRLNDRKIPIFLAKINYFLGDYNLEGVFIPFFKESHIPSFNSDWAAFGHLKETVANSNVSPFIKDLINSAEVKEDEPSRTFDNCRFGLRGLRTIGKFDLGLSYLYTRNTLPTVDSVLFKGEGYRSINSMEDLLGFFQGIDPTSLKDVAITYRYRRMNVWGGEMETTWRNMGIRAELAYFHKISFANRERSKVDKDFFQYVIGVDHTWGENLYTNLQFSQQIVANYEELFWQKKITNAFNGTIRKEFIMGFLIPELYFYWNTTDGDYYLNPFVTYKYSDNISLVGGAYFLGGERDTLFGSFKDNDQIYFSAKFNF